MGLHGSRDPPPSPLAGTHARTHTHAHTHMHMHTQVTSLLREYYNSGDINEAAVSLEELDLPQYAHYFVKRAVTMVSVCVLLCACV